MGSIKSRVSAGEGWYMDLSTSSQQVSLLTTLRPSAAAVCVCVGKDHGFHSPLLIAAHLFYHQSTTRPRPQLTADATLQKDSLLTPLLTNRWWAMSDAATCLLHWIPWFVQGFHWKRSPFQSLELSLSAPHAAMAAWALLVLVVER